MLTALFANGEKVRGRRDNLQHPRLTAVSAKRGGGLCKVSQKRLGKGPICSLKLQADLPGYTNSQLMGGSVSSAQEINVRALLPMVKLGGAVVSDV